MAFQRHDYAVMRTMLLCIASAAALASVLWYFNKLYLTFLLTVIVTLLIEHLVLTRYRTTSTIDYIFNRVTASTRHDLIYFLFSQSGTPSALMKLTYPGLVWLAMTYVNIPKIELLPHAKLLPNNALALSVLAIVVGDFQRYVSHVLLHRVPFLWNAHKFHHSGTDYNVMMFWRFTLAEAAFHEIMAILIVTVLFGRIPTAGEFFIVTTGRQVLDLLSHSNVPWHYGWLGYVFSSPRYHKMHHSKERTDYDSNYAEVFAFWDYLFGTFNRRYHADRSVTDHIEIGLENGEDASINTHKIRSSSPAHGCRTPGRRSPGARVWRRLYWEGQHRVPEPPQAVRRVASQCRPVPFWEAKPGEMRRSQTPSRNSASSP